MRFALRYLVSSVLAGVLLWPITGEAQGPPNRLAFQNDGIFGSDDVDWEQGKIRVTAIGTYDPEEIVGPGDMEIMALANAELRARAKLVEMNYGVLVTGTATLSKEDADLMSGGIVRNSQVESKEYRRFEDGSLLCVVRMSAPMLKAGNILSDQRKWEHLRDAVEQRVRGVPVKLDMTQFTPPEKKVVDAVLEEVAELKPKPVPQPSSSPGGAAYTGLIIDARHLSNKRVTWMPRIVDESDRRIYGIEDRSPAAALNAELVQYTNSEEQAGRLAGSNPLMVSAMRVDPYNPGHFVVSTADGSKIVGADARAKFLEKGNVILIF